MKKIWPLSLLGIGLCSLFLLTACQQTPEQSNEIFFKGKEIIDLEAFSGSEKKPQEYEGIIKGKFEMPILRSCGAPLILSSTSGTNNQDLINQIIPYLNGKKERPQPYEIPRSSDTEKFHFAHTAQLFIKEFPIVLQGKSAFSGALELSNLSFIQSGDQLIIEGIKNPQDPAFLFINNTDEKKGFWIGIEQELKDISDKYWRASGNEDYWVYQNSKNIIEFVVGKGLTFWEFKVHHQLGEQAYFFPPFQVHRENCTFKLPEYADNRPKKLNFHAEKPYTISFSPYFSGTSLSEVKLFHISPKKTENHQPFSKLKGQFEQKNLLFDTKDLRKERFYEEIPVQQEVQTPLSVAFTLPKKGKYELYARDGEKIYQIQLEAKEKGTLNIQDNKAAMKLKIKGDHLLTGAGLSGQLDQLLGKGNYNFTVNNLWFSRWEHWNQEHIGENELEIEYFIPPEREIIGTLKVLDLQNESYQLPIKLLVKKIEEPRISRDLYAQTFNILPAQGHRSDRIKIGSKNLQELTLYTQSCNFSSQGDFSDLKRNEILGKNTQKEDIKSWDRVRVVPHENNETTPVELHFFTCKAPIEMHKIPVKDFAYRKRTNQERELPESLKESAYFRISFDKEMKDAKYYLKSQIGLFAKVAPYKELLIWALDYATGKALETGSISIHTLDGKELFRGQPKNGLVRFSLHWGNEKSYLIRYEGNGNFKESFLVINSNGYAEADHNTKTLSRLNTEQTNQKEGRGRNESIKIYGYSDRALYKPGDTVYVAGFVQDMQYKNKKTDPLTGKVIVELGSHRDEGNKKITISKLDEFGGFEGSFQLNEKENLGYQQLIFTYTEDDKKTNIKDFEYDWNARNKYQRTKHFASYHTHIQLEEFQKFSFQTLVKKAIKDNQLYLEVKPEYYMWGALQDYDISLEYNIRSSNEDRYRWKEQDEFYFNYVNNDHFYQGARFSKEHLSWGSVIFRLWDLEKLGYKGNKLTLKLTAFVKDHLSDEVREATSYLDIEPEVRIGLNGYAYDRLEKKHLKHYTIDAKIEKNLNKVQEVVYERYFKPFGFKQSYDTEGTYYYSNGEELKLVHTGSLSPKTNFKVPLVFDKYQGGHYFLKLITKDKLGTINGEVDKDIYYYDDTFEKGFQGDMENNYTLHVNIPKKEYQVGAKIPITISPYIKGATALLTVERGDEILETHTLLLDGSPLEITAQEQFYPNVQISVNEFVGENIHNQIGSSGEQKRTEPAFYAWYAEALIQENLKTINIELTTDKKEYQPGEKVKVKILTTDHQGNPIKARVSLSVVDKALTDLYDLIKEPLPYFYNRIGTNIGNFGNWKNLYYALRTFFAKGEKGGGGNSDGSLKNIRKKFYDLAFRNAAIITTGGKAELEFTLPDNLTTWMLDAIAVSPATKLGTQRAYFKVNQALMIEANLPTFLTPWDDIVLPIRLIADEKKLSSTQQASLETKLYSESGKLLSEYRHSKTINSKFWIPIKLELSEELLNAKTVRVIGKAKAGKHEDIVERVIPIRTEGLVNKQFSFQEEKKGKHHFEFEDEILKGNITTRLTPLPAALLQKPLRYLLQNHGDTESVIRTAQTALKAESLEKLGVLATGTLHKDQIQLENGERYAIPKLLENTLHILSEKQDYDGVIHYISPKEWHRLGIYEKHPRVNPELSIATFSLLESMKLKGYGKLIPQNFEKNLIAYLDSLGYEQPEFYLFYLAQDKTTKINKGLIHNLKKQYPKNIAIQALTFYLLSTSTDQEQLLTQAEQLHLQIQSALELGQYFETEILNLKVLQGYYLQGLLEAQKRFPTQKKFEQRSTKQLLSLMKSRNQEGLRGWGLSTNFHLLESFHAALTARTAKEGELSSCKLKIWDKTLELETKTLWTSIRLPINGWKHLELERDCKGSSFLDFELEYLLKDQKKKKAELHHLENFGFEIPSSSRIGEKIPLKAHFKPLKEAKNLIVEFSIPSSIKLQQNKQPGEWGFENGIFNFENDWECFPDSYEFRFDRILLYYDKIPAGKQCSFTFYGTKAFEGKSILPPSKLYETHRTEVWGTSEIK